MTALLAVGLGYCGRHLLARPGQPFDPVVGTRRSAEAAQALAGLSRPGCRVTGLRFDGETADPALVAAIADADTLLLSAPPGAAGDPLRATAGDALRASRRLSQVIYLTTLGVYGDHGGAWVDETTVPRPGSDRLRRRLAAEADWQRFGAELGIPVAILRLAGIYGPGRSALVQLKAGEARRIDKPGQVFNRIHVDDIAASILAVVAQRFDGIVNVTDDLPAPPGDPVLFAAGLLGLEPPPAVPFAEAARTMSPMALTFWAGNKRVRNDVLKTRLGVSLAFPTYREGLAALAEEAGQ
ncbi:SDR family oxidoreductase [Aquabacter spiritensis]|uniref:Nucleoside-diphosphate-sugar epimerase n=1 Tax=Aquabacter spiritensis TaxID=933073 RepID=A0A4R3M5M4_9HYPH|nr:SDR family oxidoreductase [Aquabacter spiritensis]TCT06535.1 nucleoside-diphosphate-sugar epimerase [Aquabacter spiritensis]